MQQRWDLQPGKTGVGRARGWAAGGGEAGVGGQEWGGLELAAVNDQDLLQGEAVVRSEPLHALQEVEVLHHPAWPVGTRSGAAQWARNTLHWQSGEW